MGQFGHFLWCLSCGVSVTLRLHAYPCDLLSDATNARDQAIALKQLEFLVDALLDDYAANHLTTWLASGR